MSDAEIVPVVSLEAAVGRVDRAARVRFIAELMRDGIWESRMTKRLAQIWGLHRSSVGEYAAEAGRWVSGALDIGDVTSRIEECLYRISELAQLAEANGDYRGAMDGMAKQGNILTGILKAAAKFGQGGPAITDPRQSLIEAGWKPPLGIAGLPEIDDEPHEAELREPPPHRQTDTKNH